MNGRASIIGPYRYSLDRWWRGSATEDWILWVMLNPSTADGSVDDPTVRRCIAFSQAWGYGGMRVVNLFAYRATEPKQLRQVEEQVGPGNDTWIRESASKVATILCAWGATAYLFDPVRVQAVTKLLAAQGDLYCLKVLKNGQPAHPLYLPRDLLPVLWVGRGGAIDGHAETNQAT